MSGDFLKDTIQTIIFLMPVLALVWKGAKMSSKVEQLEATVKEKTDKFCKDHAEMEKRIEQLNTDMQKRIEEEHKNTDRSLDAVMQTLTKIEKSIVRIETKLDIEEK